MTRQNRGQTHVTTAVGNSAASVALPGSIDYWLPTTRYSLLLRAYFRSGWAFLIPYLAAYLFYAWLRWSVNPSTVDSQPSSIFPASLCLHATCRFT